MLAGCAVGADAPAVAVPMIEVLAGPAGVVAACSALVANTLSGRWLRGCGEGGVRGEGGFLGEGGEGRLRGAGGQHAVG